MGSFIVAMALACVADYQCQTVIYPTHFTLQKECQEFLEEKTKTLWRDYNIQLQIKDCVITDEGKLNEL